MDTLNIYDRKLFKSQFINIYNTNEYKFPLNNHFLSNIISRWKSNTIRFTKKLIFWNMTDYENRLILRELRVIPYEKSDKISTINLEHSIWGNDENIKRMRKRKIILLTPHSITSHILNKC